MTASQPERTRRRLRVAVYDLYWSTLGGGEQVDGSIAQVLAADHDVTLLGPTEPDVDRTMARLGVDLSGCRHETVFDDHEASEASADFDLFVNGTYLSKATNRAALGWYYVHFPGQVRSRGDRLRHWIGTAGESVLSRTPRLPERLVQVQEGFGRRVHRTDFIASYQRYLANSTFTADWVRRLWDVGAEVVYPPVRPAVQPGDKQPLIVVLGRFFDPTKGHSKKQLELLETYLGLVAAGEMSGWRLAIVGGCDADNREYALAVKRRAATDEARRAGVSVHINASGALVEELLAGASLYWHGAGLGHDVERHPERFEHFGISVVEAMAAGAVPLVFGAAGPAEIVRHGVDGQHWHDLGALGAATAALAADPQRRAVMSQSAQMRAADFSAPAFANRLHSLLAQL
jgi:glycosyltransferase involved in cell wall biosynthesis